MFTSVQCCTGKVQLQKRRSHTERPAETPLHAVERLWWITEKVEEKPKKQVTSGLTQHLINPATTDLLEADLEGVGYLQAF